MADERLLKDMVRLLMQALRETPGGHAALGRLMERNPDLFLRMMAAAHAVDGAQEVSNA